MSGPAAERTGPSGNFGRGGRHREDPADGATGVRNLAADWVLSGGHGARPAYGPGRAVPPEPPRGRRGTDRAAGRGVARQGSSWWSGPTRFRPGTWV
ncbi:hypothetical protein GCM10017688_29250 [Streptomyces ramulosus]